MGQTLKLISPATVHPEIIYGKTSERSVDWFLITDDLVVFVECKALRAIAAARVADREFVSFLQNRLDKAFKQIDRSVQMANGSNPGFTHIPRGRAMIGLVVTAEPLYTVNSPEARSKLHNASIPTLVASIREVEQFPRLEGGALAQALRSITTDPEMSGWMLSRSLAGFESNSGLGTQPIMDNAWAQTSLESHSSPTI